MYLTKVTEQWRIDTQSEVDAFIEEQKASKLFEVGKYTAEKKEIKQKGEVVDEYFRVTIVKEFNKEKEPYDGNIKPIYTRDRENEI